MKDQEMSEEKQNNMTRRDRSNVFYLLVVNEEVLLVYDELWTFILKHAVLTAAGRKRGEAGSREKEEKTADEG